MSSHSSSSTVTNQNKRKLVKRSPPIANEEYDEFIRGLKESEQNASAATITNNDDSGMCCVCVCVSVTII
jgi:hypothetical protein